MWSLGLRGEAPSTEESGLCEVKLSFNRFGAEFSKSLSQFIKYDRYVRVIDVSHNQIDNLKELVSAIKGSEALVAFDARFNKGYSSKLHKVIALKLLRNIDRLAGAKVPLKRAWIRREVLEVNYDDPAATFEEQRDDQPRLAKAGSRRSLVSPRGSSQKKKRATIDRAATTKPSPPERGSQPRGRPATSRESALVRPFSASKERVGGVTPTQISDKRRGANGIGRKTPVPAKESTAGFPQGESSKREISRISFYPSRARGNTTKRTNSFDEFTGELARAPEDPKADLNEIVGSLSDYEVAYRGKGAGLASLDKPDEDTKGGAPAEVRRHAISFRSPRTDGKRALCVNCRYFEKEFYMSESKALSLALELLRLKRQMRGSMRLFSNTQIS